MKQNFRVFCQVIFASLEIKINLILFQNPLHVNEFIMHNFVSNLYLQRPRSMMYSHRSGGQCLVCISVIIDRPYAGLRAQQWILTYLCSFSQWDEDIYAIRGSRVSIGCDLICKCATPYFKFCTELLNAHMHVHVVISYLSALSYFEPY